MLSAEGEKSVVSRPDLPTQSASEDSPHSPTPLPVQTSRQEARRRHRRSKKLESVNTWDVPEFMRGAQPRALPAEREAFERRSLAAFRTEQAARSAETLAFETERSAEMLSRSKELAASGSAGTSAASVSGSAVSGSSGVVSPFRKAANVLQLAPSYRSPAVLVSSSSL